MSSHSSSITDAMQCRHLPCSILELPCALCHRDFPDALSMTAKLLATSKAVAAATRAARSKQLQELNMVITSSGNDQQEADWMVKHAEFLQGMRSLRLQLLHAPMGTRSGAAGRPGSRTLTSEFAGISGDDTKVAATILRSMPKTLSSVSLQLPRDMSHIVDEAAMPLHDIELTVLSLRLAALPNLQSISLTGAGAAACLPCGPNLSTTFSQLTYLYLESPAGVAQLLRGLPASLQELRLLVNWRAINRSDRAFAMQLQRGVQMAHLTALTTLHVAGERFVIGEDSQLPPSLINLKVPMVMHEKPLLQLTSLQHLDVNNLDYLPPSGFASIAHSLSQLTFMKADRLRIAHLDAPQLMSGLPALPLRSLHVFLDRPEQLGAADGATSPSAAGALLGQLTGLTSLTIFVGAYDCVSIQQLAASLNRLTGLQDLTLQCSDETTGLHGDVADCESLVAAIAGLQQLQLLSASAFWFSRGYAEGGGPHPILGLQAATQLHRLNLGDLQASCPGISKKDWEPVLEREHEIQLGGELARLVYRYCP